MKKRPNPSLWSAVSFPIACSVGIGMLAPPGLAQHARVDTRPQESRKQDPSFRLHFANTDVSDVLQALSVKTKASIVFPSQMKKPISVDITAATTEEALRFVTAAAGMAYHRIGQTYVVAAPSELRQALEPFGTRATLLLHSLPAPDATKLLESALPCLTVRPMGNQVLAIGDPDDIVQARILLESQDKMPLDTTTASEVMTLQYANAGQVAALIKSMYEGVKAEAVSEPNHPGGSIGISGTQAQVLAVHTAIQQLDVKTGAGQQDRTYRVYHIRHSSAPVLQDFIAKAAPNVTTLIGPENYSPLAPGFHPLTSASLGGSSSGSGSGGSSGGSGGAASASPDTTGVRAGDRAKMLVLSGTPADLDAAFGLLEQLDVQPQQVMVEVKVVDTSPEAAEQIGIQYNFNPLNFFEVPPNTAVTGGGAGITQGPTKPAGIGQFSRFPWSFSAFLSAMVTRKEAKILASPRVMVIDNEDANIFIGDTVRTKISQASTNGTTIQVLEFPIGIVLLVRPRVNSDGRITMRVHPVVSTITSIGADNLPQTSSREAETTVMVKDGETIVLGGLIRDEMLKTVQEVPILSKLPLVGELFRFHSKDHRHSEIMVYITPHILNADGKFVQEAAPAAQGGDHVK